MADDPNISGGFSDILDQSEIDKLLASADVQKKTHIYRADGQRLDSVTFAVRAPLEGESKPADQQPRQ